MDDKNIVLNKDIKTNVGTSFPEVFKKGTAGKVVFMVDKDTGFAMVEFKIENKVYLYSMYKECFNIID